MTDFQKQFAACTTNKEVNALCNSIKNEVSSVARARRKEINAVLDAPYHDEAKRWEHGDKVYFGEPATKQWLSFDSMRITKRYNIKPGDWCRVWGYQPRKKMAWLCEPGKPATIENVIDEPFRLRDLRRYDVSRVELSIRKSRESNNEF